MKKIDTELYWLSPCLQKNLKYKQGCLSWKQGNYALIKVIAIFYTDGKIESVKFLIEDQVVKIEKVLKLTKKK